MRDYKKYNKILLKTVLGIMAGVILLNLVVDPYNILMLENGLLRPEAKYNERITKPITLKIYPKDVEALFIGTSRVDLAINPVYYKKLTGKTAANMAMGALSTKDYLPIIKYVHKLNPCLKDVYVGADFKVFSKSQESPSPAENINIKEKKFTFYDFNVGYISMQTTGNSIWTIVKNLTPVRKRMFNADGTKHIFVNKKIKESSFEESRNEYRNAYKGLELSEEAFEDLREIKTYLAQNNIRLHIFIMPTHISNLEDIHETGVYQEYVTWKKELVKIADVVDFEYPNKYTAEAIKPDMQYFFESSHATYKFGNIILDKLINNKGAIGHVLTPNNIDRQLEEDDEAYENWWKSISYGK